MRCVADHLWLSEAYSQGRAPCAALMCVAVTSWVVIDLKPFGDTFLENKGTTFRLGICTMVKTATPAAHLVGVPGFKSQLDS